MRSKFPVSAFFFSLLHIASSIPTARIDFNVCRTKNGNFPKSGSSCRSYYKCENWMVVEQVCPEDQHFSPANGYCVWSEEYPCLEITKIKECPLPEGKFIKEGTKCKVYYDCRRGVPIEKKCNGDLLFDHSKRHCEYPEFVVCPEDLTTTALTISQSTSTIITFTFESTGTRENIATTTIPPILSSKRPKVDSDENSSEEGNSSGSEEDSSSKENNQSTVTAESKPAITSTATHFKPTPSTETRTNLVTETVSKDTYTEKRGSTDDWTLKKFTYSEVIADKSSSPSRPFENENSDSTTVNLVITDSVTSNIFCPEPNGYFPHPNNKHKFIACIGDVPTIMDCPANLIYDHKKRSCEYDKS